MSTLEVPGYQPIHIERDAAGTWWLYMGSNFVALSRDQWRQFARMVADAEEVDGRGQLADALDRIDALEKDTPQARQLQLEADLAGADLAESGYRPDDHGPPVGADRHGLECQCPYCYDEPEEEPPVAEYDPGPEVDDEGGMSEYRHAPHEPEPWS